MRPVKLILSAFGSYGGCEEIDFAPARQGIFLITGDTGAGKTTIFDGITYALYGRTSGGKRDGEMMRSQYAQEDTPTYVEFTFSYGGELYTIRRNPAYQRNSKRRKKDGSCSMTQEAASVELILPGGQTYPGKKAETEEKIVEILGLDVHQFTQIAMIAQGEFLKLLHAPSKERKEIFSRIFNTRIYQQVQMKLREKSKALYGSLADNARAWEQEKDRIQCLKDGVYEDIWKEHSGFSEESQEEVTSLIESINEELKIREKEWKAQEKEEGRELERLQVQLKQAEEINGQFRDLEKTFDKAGKLEIKFHEAKEELKVRRKAYKAIVREVSEQIPNLQKQQAQIEAQLPEYEQLDICAKQIAAIDNALAKTEQLLKEAGARRLQNQAETAAISHEILSQLQEEAKRYLKEIQKKQEDHRRANQIYMELYDHFLREQAGWLAENLEEGQSCPVCGSTHHPQKAQLADEHVTQEQVEDAKQLQDNLREELENLRIQNKEIQTILKKEEERCQSMDASSKVPSGTSAEESEEPGDFRQLWKKSKRLIAVWTACRDQSVMECYHLLRKCQENVQQELLQIERERKEQQISLAQLQAQSDALRKEEANIQSSLLYGSKRLANDQLNSLQKEIDKLEKSRKKAEDACKKAEEQVHLCQMELRAGQEKISLLQKQTKGKTIIETEEWNARVKELIRSREHGAKQCSQWYAMRVGNTTSLKNMRSLWERRQILREQYERYSNLDRTANGNLSSKAKIDFETYMQRQYFRQIIQEANRRLKIMTDGQFLLQCKDVNESGRQGAVGLDLNVFSVMTNQTRDVKTLSGGESFMAALSMALGMAEIIQNNAGNVKIDTMFIDEGFGSLDDQSREQAIGILKELTDSSRLVGIISHVTELKEQMDCKLVVEKNPNGSSSHWEIDN